MKLCPECRNKFDTCGACWGNGYVDNDFQYVVSPYVPRQYLTKSDIISLAFIIVASIVASIAICHWVMV